ncbi:MAG: M14 family zinc carboxypeptidase [Bacteroidota bacterium]
MAMLIAAAVFAQSGQYSRVKVSLNNISIERIATLGIPPEGFVDKDGALILEISSDDIQKLKDNNIPCQILIADVSEYYRLRNTLPQNEEKNVNQSGCANTVWQTPAHFVHGSMGGYLTLTEMLAQLDSMRLHYPNLISQKMTVGTGHTIENRSLYYVRISDNPDVDEPEPEVLYSALTHAREPMGMQQLIFYMWYLLENYNTNTEIHNLLNNLELYFVPCVNADGYERNHTTNTNGGGMWRKNRRNNGDGTYGVDLNRNYGYQWGYDNTGSSPTTSSETYRGTAGFSEPETQIMKGFCESRSFVTSIDWHCYGNYLIYPYSYMASLLTPDSNVYKAYSQLMVHENGYLQGTPFQTLGYTANGGSIDWFYGEQSTKNKMIAWAPEAGNSNDGFWPAASRIDDIAQGDVLQNLYVARFAGRYALLADKSPRFVPQLNGYFKFDIQRLGQSAATFTVSVIPLSSNILSTGGSVAFSGMNVLESRSDSISFTLNPSIVAGDEIIYLLSCNNGLYSVSDTIRKIYGQAVSVFADAGTNINNWTTGGWGISTTNYHSAPSSITDSPSGNYSDNQNSSVTLTSSVSLVNNIYALLSFWTKWNIEKGYDYVQVKASADGGATWTPLCGKYTVNGTSNQLLGQPLYDGIQNTWVKEEIDLNDYLGQNIKLQFTLVSDGGVNADGFYFDDVDVSVLNAVNVGMSENASDGFFLSEPLPNPASGNVKISYRIPEHRGTLKVYNTLGAMVYTVPLLQNSGDVTVDVSQWNSGIYFYGIQAMGRTQLFKKLVVTE